MLMSSAAAASSSAKILAVLDAQEMEVKFNRRFTRES